MVEVICVSVSYQFPTADLMQSNQTCYHVTQWLQIVFGLRDWFTGLFDTACDYTLRYTITHTHTHTHTSVRSHVFTSRFYVAASNGGRFPSSGFPYCPGLSCQLLTTTEPQQFSNWHTHQPTQSTPLTDWTRHWLSCLKTYRHGLHRKQFPCAVQLFFSGPSTRHHYSVVFGPLPSNGSCTVGT
jgi:hypothetical protein